MINIFSNLDSTVILVWEIIPCKPNPWNLSKGICIHGFCVVSIQNWDKKTKETKEWYCITSD